MTLVLLGNLLAPVSALAASGVREEGPHKVAIQASAEGGLKSACEEVRLAVESLIEADHRVEVVKHGAVDSNISVHCLPDRVDIEWLLGLPMPAAAGGAASDDLVFARVAAAKVPIQNPAAADPPKLAAQLVPALMSALPWSAEIIKVAGDQATLSVGTRGGRARPCLPIETLEAALDPRSGKPAFSVVTQGFLSDVADHDAQAKLLPSAKGGTGQRFVRFLTANAGLPPDLAAAIQACGTKPVSTAFNTDEIELTRIDQHVGIAAFTNHATNGENVPGGLAAYVASDALIGGWVEVDIWVMHDVLAAPYTHTVGTTDVPGQVIAANGYASLHLEVDHDWYLLPGAGIFFSKMNIPYSSSGSGAATPGSQADGSLLQDDGTDSSAGDGGTSTVSGTALAPSEQIVAPSVGLGVEYDSEELFGWAMLSFWPASNRSHLDLAAELNHRLTKTWYLGADLAVIRTGPSADGAPGAVLGMIGAHIGFDVDRNAR